MPNVPNTGTFNLQDVTNAVHGDVAAERSLSGSFGSAIGVAFDAAYQGSKNHLDDFRNYQPSIVDANYVWAGREAQGYSQSFNRGATWVATSGGHNRSIAISANGKYVVRSSDYAGTQCFYVSSDYGVSWTMVTLSGPAFSVKMTANGQYMYAVMMYSWVVWSSSDYGVTWALNSSFGGVHGNRPIALSGNGQYILSNNVNYCTLSTNYGASFSLLSPNKFSSQTINAYAISDSGQYMVICNYYGDINLSTDYGATWTAKSISTPQQQFSAVAISGTGQYMIMASYSVWNEDLQDWDSYQGQIWWSTNYGATWTTTTIGWVSYFTCASISYSGQYMIVGCASATTWRSADYGSTWSTATTGGSSRTYEIAINKFPS